MQCVMITPSPSLLTRSTLCGFLSVGSWTLLKLLEVATDRICAKSVTCLENVAVIAYQDHCLDSDVMLLSFTDGGHAHQAVTSP